MRMLAGHVNETGEYTVFCAAAAVASVHFVHLIYQQNPLALNL